MENAKGKSESRRLTIERSPQDNLGIRYITEHKTN